MKRVFCSVGSAPFNTIIPEVILQQGLQRVPEAATADIVVSDDHALVERFLAADAAKIGIFCLPGRPAPGSRFHTRIAVLSFTGCQKKLRRNAKTLLTPAR